MQHRRTNVFQNNSEILTMDGGHIELHKMLVYVKTKACAPDIKIFQVLYTAYWDITITRILKSSSTTTGKISYLSLHMLMGQRDCVGSANFKDSVAFQVGYIILPSVSIQRPLFPTTKSPYSISSFQKIYTSSCIPKSARCHITQDWILQVILFPEC